MQIFSAGRTGRTDQPKVVQEVLADLKIQFFLTLTRLQIWVIPLQLRNGKLRGVIPNRTLNFQKKLRARKLGFDHELVSMNGK